jgi:phosphocarrier protein HPr
LICRMTEIVNPSGLHGRPAAQLVEAAKRYQSKLTIRNVTERGEPVNAKSIVRILGLSASKGKTVELCADGEDEIQAIEDLITLINSGFDEI